MIRSGITASLLMICLAGCGDRAGESAEADKIEVTGAAAGAPAGPAPAEVSGQAFVSTVLGGLDFALSSAQMAVERADRPSTKQLAQKMVAELTASKDELSRIANSGGLTLEPGAGPTDQSDLAILSSTRGAPLEKAFADQQMESLTLLVGTIRAYKNGGDNPQLRAWAEKHQGVVNERLLDMQTLKAELEGSA